MGLCPTAGVRIGKENQQREGLGGARLSSKAGGGLALLAVSGVGRARASRVGIALFEVLKNREDRDKAQGL